MSSIIPVLLGALLTISYVKNSNEVSCYDKTNKTTLYVKFDKSGDITVDEYKFQYASSRSTGDINVVKYTGNFADLFFTFSFDGDKVYTQLGVHGTAPGKTFFVGECK